MIFIVNNYFIKFVNEDIRNHILDSSYEEDNIDRIVNLFYDNYAINAYIRPDFHISKKLIFITLYHKYPKN